MNTEKIKAAATLLLAVRKHETSLSHLPQDCLPADAAEAYAVQDAVSLALGQVGGWKVGAKAPDAPASCAPMPASLTFAAPYHFADLLVAGERGIELEIAVRMQQDLPPRATPYTQAEVVAAVGTIHPAIEIVSSRYSRTEHSAAASPLAALADALSNGAFIYGAGRSDLGMVDQLTQAAHLYFDGQEVVSTVGGNPVGDIWPLLTWLANHLAARGDGLKAGQFVTTGSCTGKLVAAPGTQVRGDLPGIGVVEISFAQA
ncbi:2-keto-4-pentenoate hydratase [Herbaspirillum sp. Sphag1AN]|uniref:2-keto-4-pentenoate hydratase n=1 Tax=unclassified Herbaspirillum TaxID=2624150 RepID=UPI00161BCC80|nr:MULTISPECIES: 2-keto-4-pentenoate hydratase [unclassified Herbaspirillum]MBB3213720.1 2-keto-4-pentenoate hydratase [Herbaspirillum sp. Sphag1AN]MBB3246917.1 2-keto-4-pentenoate hydratase [Herbaspirillum sp. Sphag64]